MTTPGTGPGRVPMERLALEFPRSLAVYNAYSEAQRAVDYLSDHEFAVQNVLIVGTDLKQVERVMGRLTWGKVLTGGILSGMWLGLFVGLLMSMFTPAETSSLPTILSAVAFGAVFGAIWAGMGYAFTRGRRDFTSVSQVVATRYEVLVEHRLFDEARDLLREGGLTGGLAGPGAGATGTGADVAARPNPYEGRYGAMRDDSSSPGSAAVTPAGTTPPGTSRPAESRPGDPTAPPEYGVRTEPTPPADAPAPSGPRYGEGGPDAPPNPRD